MGQLLEIVTPLHKATKRDYLARMNDDKVHCMVKAKEYEFDYWDGDRRYGYGGYKFIEGRWAPVEGRPGHILPAISGRAWITAEATLLLAHDDPFRDGIRA